MSDGKNECLIWQTPVVEKSGLVRDRIDINSPRAGGNYSVTGSARAMLASLDVQNRLFLTTWLVEQRRLGAEWPTVTSYILDDIEQRRQLTVQQRMESLLRYVESKSRPIGTVIPFNLMDNTNAPVMPWELLAWTESRLMTEIITLAEYCQEEGWLEIQKSETLSDHRYELSMKPKGFARLDELNHVGVASSQAFVAMWFDDSMIDAYEIGIQPAIRDAGYRPMRIDRKDHNNKIDDEIIAEIRRSRFLVADFTQGEQGARGGVYYEAGFAHGLNLPVIFLCKAEKLKEVHFDTRQYNHITWESPSELREKLSKRISATVGDGPDKRRPS